MPHTSIGCNDQWGLDRIEDLKALAESFVAAVRENETVASPVLHPHFLDFTTSISIPGCRRPVSAFHVNARSRPPPYSGSEANRVAVALIIAPLVSLGAYLALLGYIGVVVLVAVATRDGYRIVALRVHRFELAQLVVRVIALIRQRRRSLALTRTRSGIFRNGSSNGHSLFVVLAGICNVLVSYRMILVNIDRAHLENQVKECPVILRREVR